MKRKFLWAIPLALLVLGCLLQPYYKHWREVKRRAMLANLKSMDMYTLIYRSDAPPLVIREQPDGSKKYYWQIGGKQIYKRTDPPPAP